MEKKYFTPDIEEVYVGYELQWKCQIRNQDWEKTICDTDLISIIFDQYEHADFEEPYNEQFRVPYLTKEQIEAEGWKTAAEDFFTPLFRKDNFTLGYRLEDNKLKIQTFGENSHTLYFGECKCINDFRKIQKLLNIKK
jgi:hypothetical protein